MTTAKAEKFREIRTTLLHKDQHPINVVRRVVIIVVEPDYYRASRSPASSFPLAPIVIGAGS
ncbi:hypothetical protein ACE103_24360 [Bradyrhizobium sp. ma5]|uniref:hypothetical protein n=1 Tax=Bradyrhizobium sp. ma5 TaxID=3344828 RepID=UPI0035D4A830